MSGMNPTYQAGFASPQRGRMRYPGLWRGCVGAWAPSLGNTGLALRDHSGYGNHGVLTNGPTWGPSDGINAINFDGTNDKVASIGSVQSYNFVQNTGRWTISFWARFDTNGTRLCVMGNTLASSEKGFFVIRESVANYGTNAMRITVFVGGGNTLLLGTTDDNTAQSGTWDHWAHTASDSGITGQWYKNGKPMTTTARYTPGDITFAGKTSGNSNRTMSIGTATWSSDILMLDGQISEARVYKQALTHSEIQMLASSPGVAYERSRKSYLPVAPTFKAAWLTSRQSQIIGGGMR